MPAFVFRQWMGLLLLFTVALVISPLGDAAAFLADESQMPYEEWVHLEHSANILFATSLALSIAAACLVQKGPFNVFLAAGTSVLFAIGSEFAGVIIFLMAPETWDRLTRPLR